MDWSKGNNINSNKSKQEKKDIKRTNLAREAIKQAIAKAKYRNQVKRQPSESVPA